MIMAANAVGMTLPSWAAHLDQKAAPEPLLLVQAFADTLDLDLGTDMLARAGEARAWLADAGLIDAGLIDAGLIDAGLIDAGLSEIPASDLELAREVRASILAMIALNTDGGPLSGGELGAIDRVLAEAQPRLEVTADGRVRLEATARTGGVAKGLLRLLLIIRDAQADGSWARLKLCGNPDCRWAFYDRSHSHRGAWCDMASCGNRLKNRNLRARRAQAS
jgi:predicted RNA-binding Zn ribbon-like protein